jgi:hypothetical protein
MVVMYRCRFFSQGVFRVHSVYTLTGHLLLGVCFVTHPRCSTRYILVCVSFA